MCREITSHGGEVATSNLRKTMFTLMQFMLKDLNFILLIGAAFVIVSCKSHSNEIQYPEGGYNYPDSFHQSLRDSFYSSLYMKQWSLAYDEPDISIKPLNESVFRLVYESAFGEAAIFILKSNKLIIKQPMQGNPYPAYDSLILYGIERPHFKILQRDFPIQEMDPLSSRKKRNDSLAKIYPKLLDPHYYSYLLNKSVKPDSIPFKYTTKIISLTDAQYSNLINQINSSGYWKLPRKIECDFDYTDGYGILLEANTPKRYNSVSQGICYEKELKFSKACQAIIDLANLDKKIVIVPKE